MDWESAELTIPADLKAYESELNTLTDIAETTYTIENESINHESTVNGAAIYVSQSKGGAEVIIQAMSELTIPTEMEMYLEESSDNVTWEAIEGQYGKIISDVPEDEVFVRFPISENSLEYIRVSFDSTTGNSGSISAMIEGLYSIKIKLAKEKLKQHILSFLASSFGEWYRYRKAKGDNPIDMIANPMIFAQPSTLLTLYLIYSDFASGGKGGSYQEKADRYKLEYETEFSLAVGLIDIDLNMDDDVDIYASGIGGILYL